MNVDKHEITIKITKAGRCHKIKVGAVVATHAKQKRAADENQSYRVTAPLKSLLGGTRISEEEQKQGWAPMWVFGDECQVLEG